MLQRLAITSGLPLSYRGSLFPLLFAFDYIAVVLVDIQC